MAVAVKQLYKCVDWITKVAVDLLGLMNIRVIRDESDAVDSPPTDYLPPIYIEGLFICAFCETYFDRHFEFLSGKDPQFGNSYGQTMRLYIEHAAIMHEEVEFMVNNWDNNERCPHFKAFNEAIDKLPESGDTTRGDKTFFLECARTFFKKYKQSLEKHVFKIMRSNTMLVYLIGGNSTLAIQLLKWLKFCESNFDWSDYQFDDADIRLKHHGQTYGEEGVKVNVRSMMNYLIRGPPGADPETYPTANPEAIMKDPIIGDNKDLLWEMAEEDPLQFDLFDKSTWQGVVDYTPIIDLVHKQIAIHPVHQQRCELHVQMAAYVASTNVGEVRRSCRALCLSSIFRPYHQWALEKYQKKRDKENAKLADENKSLKKKKVN